MRGLSHRYWHLPAVAVDIPAAPGGRLVFDGMRWLLHLPAVAEVAERSVVVRPLGAPLLLSCLLAQRFQLAECVAGLPPAFRLLRLSPACSPGAAGPARREQWRRLVLALRYGSGLNTVSSAVAAVAG